MFKNSSIKFFVSFCLLFLGFVGASSAQFAHDNGFEAANITPLMNAVNSEDEKGVEFFARSGKEVVEARNIGGATALHIASRGSNIEIVKILLSNGANVNSIDNDGWTPLMRAAANNNPDIVSELLTHNANANIKNSLNETALIQAVNSGCYRCLESILNYFDYKKADKAFINDQFSEALEIAGKKSNSELKDILTKYKERIDKGEYPTLVNYEAGKNIESVNSTIRNESSDGMNSDENNAKIANQENQGEMSQSEAGEKIASNENLAVNDGLPAKPIEQTINQEAKKLKKKNYVLIVGKSWVGSVANQKMNLKAEEVSENKNSQENMAKNAVKMEDNKANPQDNILANTDNKVQNQSPVNGDVSSGNLQNEQNNSADAQKNSPQLVDNNGSDQSVNNNESSVVDTNPASNSSDNKNAVNGISADLGPNKSSQDKGDHSADVSNPQSQPQTQPLRDVKKRMFVLKRSEGELRYNAKNEVIKDIILEEVKKEEVVKTQDQNGSAGASIDKKPDEQKPSDSAQKDTLNSDNSSKETQDKSKAYNNKSNDHLEVKPYKKKKFIIQKSDDSSNANIDNSLDSQEDVKSFSFTRKKSGNN